MVSMPPPTTPPTSVEDFDHSMFCGKAGVIELPHP